VAVIGYLLSYKSGIELQAMVQAKSENDTIKGVLTNNLHIQGRGNTR
jgi:hypothetical protein